MTAEEIVCSVADVEDAFNALPESLQLAVRAMKNEHDRKARESADRKAAEEQARQEAEARQKALEEAEKEKFLRKGEWGYNVPVDRRFCLCKKKVRRFVGIWGEEGDESKWQPKTELCVIDIVRGYTNPYWGYHCCTSYQGELNRWYEEGLLPILSAKTDSERCRIIRRDFDFFRIKGKELDDKFRILKVERNEGGDVKVIAESDERTLEEHRQDLEREFS